MGNTQKITLGGQEFDIPELPLGVQRHIVPITNRMSKRAVAAKENSQDELIDTMMGEENMNDAQMTVAIALAYISPDFKPSNFDSLIQSEFERLSWVTPPIPFGELISASLVIAMQAAGKKLGEKMPEALKNLLADQPPANPLISTPSSQTSALASDGNGITLSGQ